MAPSRGHLGGRGQYDDEDDGDDDDEDDDEDCVVDLTAAD
jgi:hypothetical protein